MLDDTWFLRMTLATEPTKDPLTLKWEKRKKPSTAYAPSLRSGGTMTLWAAKGMGVLFGGVSDEDTGEETLESVFFNDLYVSPHDLVLSLLWLSAGLAGMGIN